DERSTCAYSLNSWKCPGGQLKRRDARKLMKYFDALFDLFVGEIEQTFRPKSFDRKGCHCASVYDGAFERIGVDALFACQIPGKSARKGVAGAGRIVDDFEREGRRDENGALRK